MPLLVVRHARAGHRREWEGDDRLRPLDEKGCSQAEGLPGLLARFEIARIASGSYLRCTQTVEPLSEQRGLPIEELTALSIVARAKRAKIDLERARTLPAGAIILAELQRGLQVPLGVADGGVREGVCTRLLEAEAATA